MAREVRLRFHPLSALDEGPQALDEAGLRYLIGALRLRHGQALTLFDGAGMLRPARLEERAGAWVLCAAGECFPGRVAAPVSLAFALPKGEKLDLVARQCCELGLQRLYLWSAARSVTRWAPARITHKLARLARVTAEAARQCGRADELEVVGPLSLSELITESAHYESRLVLSPEAPEPWPTTTAAPAILLVGPEGGVSDEEQSTLQEAGWRAVRWSTPVLRTETAAVVGAALALAATGQLSEGTPSAAPSLSLD